MNYAAFDPQNGEGLNANFVAVASSSSAECIYLVQRLAGIEVDETNKGRQRWVVYLNDQRYDWNEVCKKDIEVSPAHSIEWKLETIQTP